MDTTTYHGMADLFAQLGLPNTAQDIQAFVRLHSPLPDNLRLSEAPCWSPAQAHFLREQILADDGDWALMVDHLSAQLRQPPDAQAAGAPRGPSSR